VEERAPKVSVLLGVFDNERTVARAISSIRDQTERDLELIVVDDGSTDGSIAAARAAIAGDPRCRLVEIGRNVGIARSLNEGLAQSRGEIVAIQDADDFSDEARLERQLEALGSSEDVAVVGALTREVDAAGREVRSRTRRATGDVTARLSSFNPIPNGIAAFRRAIVLELGGYDERYLYAPDYDLWLRVADEHRLAVLDEVLATRVMTGANVAARAEREQAKEAIAIQLRAMRRRRSPTGAVGLARAAGSYLVPTSLKRTLRRRRGQAP
jgi:glycosyltransferase involved in cell wall biosynthesis